MVGRLGLLVVAAVAIIIVVAVLFFLHVLNFPAQNTALSNVSNISSMFATAQGLYNSSGPFNISYTFQMKIPYFSTGPANAAPSGATNGTFRIAKYGSYFRTYSTSSTPFPYNILNASVLLNNGAVTIYNDSHLTFCEKETITNETPVNASIESTISSINSKPMSCNSTALAVSPFYIVSSFAIIPFETFHTMYDNFTSLELSKGSVHFLGYRTYLGQSCSMEEILPPPNETGSTGVSINDCISSANGLPLYVKLQVNGSVFAEDTVSAINPAPSNANDVTALPPGAILG